MNSVLRIFHPIGQGSFYSEHFCIGWKQNCRLNVVYDCGTLSRSKYLKDAIDNMFREGEPIEAVFISHLHKDHISGIPDLIKHCNVKKIYFPLLTKQNKILAKIRLIAEGVDSKFCFRFIDSPKKAIESELGDKARDIRLIGVFPDKNLGKNDKKDPPDSDYISNSGKDIKGICDSTIQSGTSIAGEMSIFPKWIYIPYNFDFYGRNNMLIKELEHERIKVEEITELGTNPGKYKKKISTIKKLYGRVDNDFNSHSMTLYSGAITDRVERTFCYALGDYEYLSMCGNCPSLESARMRFVGPCQPLSHAKKKREEIQVLKEPLEESYSKRSGCLYTGDLKMFDDEVVNKLKREYSGYWETLMAMQVPHHGSKVSFNKKLVMQGVYYIISAAKPNAGKPNKYDHPGEQVKKDICQGGGNIKIVTEDFDSNVCFETLVQLW